jgi:hypothetical protein
VDLYDFEVLRSEEVIAAERSIPLYSPKAAWPKIIELAKSVNMPGMPHSREGAVRGNDHSRGHFSRPPLLGFRLFVR